MVVIGWIIAVLGVLLAVALCYANMVAHDSEYTEFDNNEEEQ
jgi:hypothetical protein